ncbi:MAG: formyl-CoA transferase [Gammaproteobacteria bacterium]|nr:formyl-CoA transferase [Gammaproteobacteria bacterium]
MKPALQNIRVVEMTEALAGPYCAMMLGDLGAEVIKVERPETGDQARGWGPPFLESESAYFLSVNRNKRSIELNIKDPNDLSVLYGLIKEADVFITNIPRMSSLARAKIDPETLKKLNPKLIYAAITGYGHTGPKANRGGYDIIAQGEAGLMTLTGETDGGPMRFPTPMADITAGIYTTIGILAALYARDNKDNGSHAGQFLDVSLVDAQTTWLANLGGSFFATGDRPERLGNIHPTVTPYQPMQARDKMIIVGVGTERLWEKLCFALDLDDDIKQDPRFLSNAARNMHRSELIELLESKLITKDAADWVEVFVKNSIPAGPINYPEDTLTDEHIIARDMIVELEHPLLGIVKSIGNPIHLSENGPTYRRYPPRLGEHNEEIRQEIKDRV